MRIVSKGLTYTYNKNTPFASEALKDVSLTIEEGEFFGFIGPNGAGKSTTLRVLLGLVSPTSGTGNGNVTVKTLKNTLTSRTATVTINGVKSGKKIVLTVQQEGGFNVSIGRDEYNEDKKL